MKAAMLSVATLCAAIEPPRNSYQPVGNGDRLLTFNETIPAVTIRPRSVSVSWSSAGDDGQYITTNDDGDLVLEDIVTGDTETFITGDKLPSDLREYWISPDTTKILISSNATSQYRYTYFADYSILDVETGESVPLVEDQVGDIQYAGFAPSGDVIAFVRGNDLYLRDHSSGDITQITNNGSPDMFNAVPDWVYEEEIFGTTSTLWFSPDAEYVAFLSFNETGVETYTIPYYMDNQPIAPTYPDYLDLRYPKVGSKNPTVQLNLLTVKTGEYETIPVDAFPEDELVIGEVAWVTDTHTSFIYRAYNRVQDKDTHVVVDAKNLSSKVVRERDGTDGWLENLITISYVGSIGGSNSTSSGSKRCNGTYYVDLSDESGWSHLYLYPVQGGSPIQLTEGDWEVTSILSIDPTNALIYYAATTRHSTERHLYKVNWRDGSITPLVDDKKRGYWSASFSSGGGYYILSYLGPDVPYQELYASDDISSPIRTIEDNADFYEKIDEFALPNITYFELEHPEGFSINVLQQLPANFDPSKSYPVLFTPYGGPNSQYAAKRFQPYDWEAYIASDPELEYITYTIDNRGTGFKGREFRATVTGQLGKLEPLDQIWAAEELAKRNSWINADKIGMFGWSYGGYLTAKTLEADSGVFAFGHIVAPVTDWRFYDSMYTERYMKKLDDNEEGYLETAVHSVDGFKNVPGGFTVLHGTGDDNVHYQHTAALIDLLVGGGVTPEEMDMFAFTDSNHRINYNGAYTYIYKLLTKRLYEEVQRDVNADALVHQWSKRQVTVL